MHRGASIDSKGSSHLLLRGMNKETPTVPPESPISALQRAETWVLLLSQTPPDSSPSSIRVAGLLWDEHGDNDNTDEN